MSRETFVARLERIFRERVSRVQFIDLTADVARDAIAPIVASASIARGHALHTSSSGKAEPATSGLRTRIFAGVAKEAASADGITKIHTSGPLDRAIKNLGSGVACAVGVDADGHLVRASDPACVSAPNWVGDCDTDGTITIAPRRERVFNAWDFGLDPSGTDACDDLNDAMLAATSTGDVVFYPHGKYRFTRTIEMPRLQMGITLEGSNGSQGQGIDPSDKTVLAFENATGDGIRVCTDPTTNSHGFVTLRKLTIDQSNSSNRAWESEAGPSGLLGGAAIGMIGGQRLTCKEIETTGVWRFGIAIDGGELCEIEDYDARHAKAGGEADGDLSFGIWLGGGTRGMSVGDATNVIRMQRIYGNSPAFLFLLDTSASNSIRDGLQNIGTGHVAGIAMFRGAGYLTIENMYAEGSNLDGGAAYYFVGACTNIQIKGGLVSGHIPFARLGPNPFGPDGQAIAWRFEWILLSCDWIIGANNIINTHFAIGNTLSGDIANARGGRLYDVQPGMTNGFVGNTIGSSALMGTGGDPRAQHHWVLKDYAAPLHLDSVGTFDIQRFWIDGTEKNRHERQVFNPNTGRVGGAVGSGLECNNYAAGSATHNLGGIASPGQGGGRVRIDVEMVREDDRTKKASFSVWQHWKDDGSGPALVGSPTPDVSSDLDGDFVAPVIVISSQKFYAQITEHPTHTADFSAFVSLTHAGA